MAYPRVASFKSHQEFVQYLGELYVGPLRESSMVLDEWSDGVHMFICDVIDEDHAMGISHRYAGHME